MKAAPSNLLLRQRASTYQIVANAPAPDYRVRIDSKAANPDLREASTPPNMPISSWSTTSATRPRTCKSSTRIRTVTLDGSTGSRRHGPTVR